MTESDFKTVDEYIAAQPGTARVALNRANHDRQSLAGGGGVISYKIPAYKCVA